MIEFVFKMTVYYLIQAGKLTIWKSMDSFFNKTIDFTLVFLAMISLLACSSQIPYLNSNQNESPPFGNWYSKNRHMQVKRSTRQLTDTITYKSKDYIEEYYITSIIKKPDNRYLFTLSSIENKNSQIRRYFILHSNFKSMREFDADRVVYWTRAP